MIDLLKNSYELRGKGQKLDVMDVIYNEIWGTVIDRRAPIFGPYLMRLIRNKWWHATKEDITKDGSRLVLHRVKKLNVKEHVVKAAAPSDAPSAPPAARAGRRSATKSQMDEPTWAQLLKIKVKRAFCFKIDLEDRMYEAHVYHKKAAKRQTEMERKMGMDVSPPGSEEDSTPKEQWVSPHGYWSDDDAPPGGSRFQASSSSTYHGMGGV